MNTEEIKEQMKAEYARAVDVYFERYAERKGNGTLDIDGIEALLGSGIADAKDILVSASEELLKSETEGDVKKKRVHGVKEH